MASAKLAAACARKVRPHGQDQHSVHFVFRVLLATHFDDVGWISQSGRSRSKVVDCAAERLGACCIGRWLRTRRAICPSQGFTSLNKGETPAAVHFAQVNEMDGFFLTGREADPGFTWDKLEGAEVVMFKGGQPIAMLKYACCSNSAVWVECCNRRRGATSNCVDSNVYAPEFKAKARTRRAFASR